MSYPTTPKPRTVERTSISPTFVSKAHSGKRQARAVGSHMWKFKLDYPPMTRATFAPLDAFLVAQRGQYATFTFVLFGHESPLGIATGTPLVKGASQTGRSVTTDGWTINQTGILKAGDFIKFGGHSKVYMITADANSDGSGNATLTIEPALMTSPSDNEAITASNVPFTCALASDSSAGTGEAPQLYRASVELVEVI